MITKYDEFLLESRFNDNNVELILERSAFAAYKEIQQAVLKDYGKQLYFVTTFNSAIISLYPIVNQVIYNSDFNITITPYQIVLLTIFSIAEILHVNNDAINNMKSKLKQDGLAALIDDVKRTLESVQKVVQIIGRTIGKTISFFVDMLGYVTLLVPINEALIEIIKNDGLNLETLPKKILGLGMGLGIFTLKNIIIKILNKIGIKTSTDLDQKIENSIKGGEKTNNVYHKMQTREKIK